MIKKNLFLNICIISLTFVISIIVIYLLSMSLFIMKHRESDYYLMGKDNIPSIYKVNGKRNLYYYKSSNKNNNDIKVFKYRNIEDVKSDLTNYIDELKDNYNYAYTSDIDLSDNNGSIELSSNSVDIDKIIIINITYDKSSYVIKITKGKGNINFYK
ncbi:MAG: hypothetical protein IJ105_00875 [Bacilli bacterium]|nr:hypothetical protein [Bacilli bacterium]